MNKPIYLDYAATTPVDKAVAEEMSKYLSSDGIFGNPSSKHVYGFQADDVIENTRSTISGFLKCKSREIIFTSGATESNNIAIKGIARANKGKGNQIITSVTEHKAVLDTCRALENEGFEVTYLKPDIAGIISSGQLREAIKPETILVSIMHVNNETGVIQDITELGNIIKEHDIYFHVDAAQSFGKLPINLSNSPIDLLSCSSHKIYGPKGMGILYIRNRAKTKIESIVDGGGQEFGIRPGTLPTHQIAGFGKAIEIANNKINDDFEHAKGLKEYILDKISSIENTIINGQKESGLPNIINVSFIGVDSKTLITSLL